MVITRENTWVRVWRTGDGDYADSRYRTYECSASPEEVLAALQSGDESERRDIERALEFFPYSREMHALCHCLVAIAGLETGHRIEEQWFGSGKDLRPETLKFLAHTLELALPRTLVCDTPWFRAWWDGFSYRYETEGKLTARPDYEDFCAEYLKARSRLHRDVLNLYWGFPREI